MVAVGQREGIVPAAVVSRIDTGYLLHSQYIQGTAKVCNKLDYTVFSQKDVSLELYPDGPCSIVSCLPGFSLQNSSLSCVCDQILQKYTSRCNITNGLSQITRESDDTFWVGYDQSQGIVTYCPFDYCVIDRVVFPLNNTDIQFAYNRSGLLCGQCKNGYSLVLGTFQYPQPSCLAHSFCSTSDGSSTDLLAPCLQTDSSKRNTQWTSFIC